MQRLVHSKENQPPAQSWLLVIAAAYSAEALVIVLISALWLTSSGAGLEGLSGPAPGFNKGGLHSRSQTYPMVEAQPARAVVARR